MQVKKFEAPTIQEALDTIKRELGPEAVILQTKKNRKGFGLMSNGSVEVTAAVSERTTQRKKRFEHSLTDEARTELGGLPAQTQAKMYQKFYERGSRVNSNEKREEIPFEQQVLAKAQAQAQARAKAREAAFAASRAAKLEEQARNEKTGGVGAIAQKVGSRLGLSKKDESSQARRPITSTPYVDIDRGEEISVEKAASNPVIPSVSIEKEENLSDLKGELQSLKDQLEQLRHPVSVQNSSTLFESDALQSAFEQLILNGLDKKYAMSLIKQASFELGKEGVEQSSAVSDQLATLIMENTETLSLLDGIDRESWKAPALIALVGPTGVGKTTTLAKIASEATLNRELKVGLINLDTYKIAAADQLATYARILNVPFRSVGDSVELKSAIQDFHSLDLVLIDTTGRSQKDEEALKEMEAILHSVPNLRTELVASATTRDTDLHEVSRRFSIFRPEGLIFSKLDETSTYGCVYNISHFSRLPLVYFGTGQRVPEDLEEASCERVVSLMMDL